MDGSREFSPPPFFISDFFLPFPDAAPPPLGAAAASFAAASAQHTRKVFQKQEQPDQHQKDAEGQNQDQHTAPPKNIPPTR